MARTVDERLEAQLAYLRSDEKLLEEARIARGMTPEERLRVAYDLCRVAAEMQARQPPEVLARVDESREPPPPDAEAVLRRLGRGGR
jgi:hypothetical protein